MEQAEKEVEEARRLGHMNLTLELDRLEKKHAKEEEFPYEPLLWHKLEIWREMARRIEALEASEHCHPLGVNSYCPGSRTAHK